MTDTIRAGATGLTVKNVLDLDDETIINFTNGKSIRHRKRPLPETSNSLVFLEGELNKHRALTYDVAHPVHPAKGTIIQTHCLGFDKYNQVADGAGGYREVLVEANSATCGYNPNAAYGFILGYYCSGFNYRVRKSDGKGGEFTELIEANSRLHCGYTPPPAFEPAGTFISEECVGFDLWRTEADGKGGTVKKLVETNNIATCGYKPMGAGKPWGTTLSTYCLGYDLWATKSDGNNGTYNEKLESNNVATCGYTPTPAQGTILDDWCVGYNRINRIADGSGGYDDVVVESNSLHCGYTPPVQPFVTTLDSANVTAVCMAPGPATGGIRLNADGTWEFYVDQGGVAQYVIGGLAPVTVNGPEPRKWISRGRWCTTAFTGVDFEMRVSYSVVTGTVTGINQSTGRSLVTMVPGITDRWTPMDAGWSLTVQDLYGSADNRGVVIDFTVEIRMKNNAATKTLTFRVTSSGYYNPNS